MAYRNRFDRDGTSQQMGESAEDLFYKIAISKKVKIQKASLKQQLSHIDFILTDKNNKSCFLDVKACKKNSRSSKDVNEDVVWIEFKNVAGNTGWLYGVSDFIVFERENDFVIVPKKPLILLCERLVNKNIIVDKPQDALYNIYTRKNRKDQISLIKMTDILNNIKITIWQK